MPTHGAPITVANLPGLIDPQRVDVDGNGFSDIVAADPLNQRIVVIRRLFANFEPPAFYAVAGTPIDITTGDLDGSFGVDIAVALDNETEIARFFNDGVGGFTPSPIDLAEGTFVTEEAVAVTAGDFGGTTQQELVAVVDADTQIYLRAYDEDGTTSIMTYLDDAVLPGAEALELDGVTALAAGHFVSASTGVDLVIGYADGRIRTFSQYLPGSLAFGVNFPGAGSIADLQGANLVLAGPALDLAVAKDGTALAMGGTGFGPLSPVFVPVFGDQVDVFAGNYDSDSYPDLALTVPGSDVVTISRGHNGTYDAPVKSFFVPDPTGALLGDADVDGDPDVLTFSADGIQLWPYVPSGSGDDDGDGTSDGADNCPSVANPDQLDADDDGLGDACDADDDGDGVDDDDDTCPLAGGAQTDTDGDGSGDVCDADDDGDGVDDADDTCPLAADASQADGDGDGIGTACDPLEWTFDGFYAPVDNWPTVNDAKAGSTIPVKFSLGGDRGRTMADVFAAGYPRSVNSACEVLEGVDAIESTLATNVSGVSYDPLTTKYQYAWKTDRSWRGCRVLVVRTRDGGERRAMFRFK